MLRFYGDHIVPAKNWIQNQAMTLRGNERISQPFESQFRRKFAGVLAGVLMSLMHDKVRNTMG
jgi:hypothetical protein